MLLERNMVSLLVLAFGLGFQMSIRLSFGCYVVLP